MASAARRDDHRHRPGLLPRRRDRGALGRAEPRWRLPAGGRCDDLCALAGAPDDAAGTGPADPQARRPAADGGVAAHRHLRRGTGTRFRRREGQRRAAVAHGHDRRCRRRRARLRGGCGDPFGAAHRRPTRARSSTSTCCPICGRRCSWRSSPTCWPATSRSCTAWSARRAPSWARRHPAPTPSASPAPASRPARANCSWSAAPTMRSGRTCCCTTKWAGCCGSGRSPASGRARRRAAAWCLVQLGCFLVIESREHAVARGATALAHIAADRHRPLPPAPRRGDRPTPRTSSWRCAIISSRLMPPSSRELRARRRQRREEAAFLRDLGMPVRATATRIRPLAGTVVPGQPGAGGDRRCRSGACSPRSSRTNSR